MFGGLGAIVGGTVGAMGSMASSALQYKNAEKDRNMQRDMSRSAHQREVKDLRAAGLNPILSGMGGKGASTGTGSSLGPIENPASSAMDFVKKGTEAKKTKLEHDQVKSQINRIDAETKFTNKKTKMLDIPEVGIDAISPHLKNAAKGAGDVTNWIGSQYGSAAFKLNKYMRDTFNSYKDIATKPEVTKKSTKNWLRKITSFAKKKKSKSKSPKLRYQMRSR